MAPRRRSSRLRSTTTVNHLEHPDISKSIVPIAEGDEASTPKIQLNNDDASFTPQTPVTAGRIKPAPEEMHPSKVHQSTTQEPDSGLRLGFTDIEALGCNQPSGITQQTPSKISVTKPSFDFRFTRPGLQFGSDSKMIMDEVYEEALRIKARLADQREENKQIESVNRRVNSRNLASARSTLGRFSNAHMAEFKKMGSIAEHPSAIRAQLSRSQSARPNLKRSISKARLDEVGDNTPDDTKCSRNGEVKDKIVQHQNIQPNKRARKNAPNSISSKSRNNLLSNTPRSRKKLPSVINTPTQATLARASGKKIVTMPSCNLKSSQKAKLQNISEPSVKPTTSCSLTNIPSNSKNMSGPSGEDISEEISHSTLTDCKNKCDLQKVFSKIPTTPIGIRSSKDMKHVNFTPETVNKRASAAQISPSPIKSDAFRPMSKIKFDGKPATHQLSAVKLNNNRSVSQTMTSIPVPSNLSQVEYPKLPLSESPRQVEAQDNTPLSIPGTFTFRSDQTINFGLPVNDDSSISIHANIRQALNSKKPSKIPSHITSGCKENEQIISLPHGMSNKRRKQPDSDDDEQQFKGSSPKKLKSGGGGSNPLVAPNLRIERRNSKTTASPQKKRGVLSLSRLNFLACPKVRR